MLPLLLPLIGDVLRRVIPDGDKRAEAQEQITAAIVSNEQALMQSMAEVMKADAQSESWLTRSTRPLVVLWGLFMVTFVGVVAPALGIQKEVVDGLAGIPADLWTIVTVGVGIWMGGRTVEKAVANLKAPR